MYLKYLNEVLKYLYKFFEIFSHRNNVTYWQEAETEDWAEEMVGIRKDIQMGSVGTILIETS